MNLNLQYRNKNTAEVWWKSPPEIQVLRTLVPKHGYPGHGRTMYLENWLEDCVYPVVAMPCLHSIGLSVCKVHGNRYPPGLAGFGECRSSLQAGRGRGRSAWRLSWTRAACHQLNLSAHTTRVSSRLQTHTVKIALFMTTRLLTFHTHTHKKKQHFKWLSTNGESSTSLYGPWLLFFPPSGTAAVWDESEVLS